MRYGITYRTSHYGSAPIGEPGCTGTDAGCFYDSLNVAVNKEAPSVGTTDGIGTMKLRADGSVDDSTFDTVYKPSVQFKAG